MNMFHINGDYYNAEHVVSIAKRAGGGCLMILANGPIVEVDMSSKDLAEFIRETHEPAERQIAFNAQPSEPASSSQMVDPIRALVEALDPRNDAERVRYFIQLALDAITGPDNRMDLAAAQLKNLLSKT